MSSASGTRLGPYEIVAPLGGRGRRAQAIWKPVNRRLSLLAVFVILVGCAIQALTILLYLAPLVVLTGGSSVSAFTAEQLQALALVFLKLNARSFDIYLVFFGLWCVLIGFLLFRSTFLPRILGVLMTISGLGHLTFLLPPLASHLFVSYIAAAAALGEIPLFLWLLIFGVNAQRDVVQIREVEKRVSKEDEVLIRVRKLRPIQLTGTGVWKKGTLSEKR